MRYRVASLTRFCCNLQSDFVLQRENLIGRMVSEKEKEKSRKRSPPLSTSDDEEHRRKRHRRGEDGGEKRSSKTERSEKRKDKKSHKHRSHKENKSKDKHKDKHDKHKSYHIPNFQEISNDDYFCKNNEFATWLKEEKDVFFSDLSSESAREKFSGFVKDWNNRKLEPRYYEGISSGPRCAHSWSFRKQNIFSLLRLVPFRIIVIRIYAPQLIDYVSCPDRLCRAYVSPFCLRLLIHQKQCFSNITYIYYRPKQDIDSSTFQKLDEDLATCINCRLQNWPENDGGTNSYNIQTTPFRKLKSLTFCFRLGKTIPKLESAPYLRIGNSSGRNRASNMKNSSATLNSRRQRGVVQNFHMLARCSIKFHNFKPESSIPGIHIRRKFLKSRPISVISSPCRELEQEPTNTSAVNHGSFITLSNHPNHEISCFYQKGFSQITNEITGKALHAICITGLSNLGVFSSNTLINMYSKFGDITLARHVFDKMPERNEASWNHIFSAFVRAGLYQEAIGLFNEMRDFGVKPSGFAFASLISGCERSGCMLSEGIQFHDLAVKFGMLCDVFVGTSLLHLYGTYGLAFNARKVFEEMPEKNVVSWTAIMVAYADFGDPMEVMNLYSQMRWEGLICNANTLAAVVSSCASLEDEFLCRQVFGHVVKSGLRTNVSVENSLISMFGALGRAQDACHVFIDMNERDTISWNSMISVYVHNSLCEESLICFHRMRHVHVHINSTTISALLSGCGSVDYIKWGRGIHSLVIKLGLDSNVCVCNTLIAMYSGAGDSEYAHLVFHRMVEKDLISWNSMLACYAQGGKCIDALEIFTRIFHEKKSANFVTFTSALAACSDSDFLTEGRILHGLVILTGLHESLIVGNALVTLYAKCGKMIEANKIFQIMSGKDEVTWNALIGGYANNGESDEAVNGFKLMRESIPASYITIANVLGAFSSPNNLLIHGMPIHAYVVVTGLESAEYVQNSLILMYAKCGDLNSSNYIFDGLSKKNAVAWNTIMAANAHHGEMEEALKLLVKMRQAGVDLDQFSFSGCLSSAATLAMLEEGQQLQSLAVKLGFDSDPFVTNATMDMYAKCGELDDVRRIIPQPLERSRLSWNTLISSYARHGNFEMAKETFHEMLKFGMTPDNVTFISLLSACSHAGLVKEGLEYYHSMTKEFGISADIKHCVCIVDLLGRAGRLAEADAFIREMPVPPTDFVWRSLLSACKTHGNLDLGRKAAENLLKLDASDDSAYVLYSNICASTGRWDDAKTIRNEMGSNKIKKKPAYSWVKLKNTINSFGMGDQSHPQSSQIYAKLEELKKMVKEAGYVPDTSNALHDTDEEQKEHNLWNHSERLALAFGLISSPESSTLKVFKNLRVCGDCHSVYKFVSEVLGRKITLKDPYRFHHFSEGKCSCADYW
ncbi:pentatricopeptide repeat-containing protein At3g49170, chloroplastic [Mercurialis annua]|uniref:pentatricopeptide repeat-containing protein At3g49170, chloroplastic n=1 Tax=Mercurialis annua TaxID=3986 RepID=UPI0024ADDFBF|nr:pentatricopeptide repeat-containing protein At3g49170, chloroplastic [Mercurialis annua]